MARQNGPVQSLTGTAASSGIARGPWILVAPEPPPAGGPPRPGGAGGRAAHRRALGDDLLAARAADLIDVAARVARHLAGRPEADVPRMDEAAIVVAHDLAPSLAATLPRQRLPGLALEAGSKTPPRRPL